MAVPTPTFLVTLFLLAYLLSFVLFAFIRVVTGVSIQRLGVSGLRRIAFTPKDGLRIEIRGLGLTLHRPTFARPTWISVRLTELKVTVDLKALQQKSCKKRGWAAWGNGTAHKVASRRTTPDESAEEDEVDELVEDDGQRSKTWERLTAAKEKIKHLHRQIKWIRLVDVDAATTTLAVVDVGSLQIGSFTMAVDTRRKTVDRSRLFSHHKTTAKPDHRPAEWIISLRSILFTPEGKDLTEILDHCAINIHGMLYQELDGLRDASISIKLGRLNIPYDDVKMCMDRAKRCRTSTTPLQRPADLSRSDISLDDVMEELDQPGTRDESIARAVSDSKEFASSILRGIHEFQFAVSYFGLTKELQSVHEGDNPVFLNVSMKEVGMDLLRLDPRSPAHLMYFSPNDIAHQALLAASSILVSAIYRYDNNIHDRSAC